MKLVTMLVLELKDLVIRLSEGGRENGEQGCDLNSRTLLLPVYSPFLRDGYCL